MEIKDPVRPGEIFTAFNRLNNFAPKKQTLRDLAEAVLYHTKANTPRGMLRALGCEVKKGACGGPWTIIPVTKPDGPRWVVIVDPKRCLDLQIAYCECITAILFDHFGKIGSYRVPDDVQKKRELLYRRFSEELLLAIRERKNNRR